MFNYYYIEIEIKRDSQKVELGGTVIEEFNLERLKNQCEKENKKIESITKIPESLYKFLKSVKGCPKIYDERLNSKELIEKMVENLGVDKALEFIDMSKDIFLDNELGKIPNELLNEIKDRIKNCKKKVVD
jgi:hypothetical protein